MSGARRTIFIAFAALLFAPLRLSAATPTVWIGSWAAAQQVPESRNALPPEDLTDTTLRQVVHLSVGGAMVRVHLSNAFGTTPLHILSVHIALPDPVAPGAILPASDRALLFAGNNDVIIPPGAEFVSDAIRYPVAALSDLVISLHIESPPTPQTGHPGSRSTSYIAHGDLTSSAQLPTARSIGHWYFLAAVDVAKNSPAFTVIALGDSITDGQGATVNGNNRWPDALAARLQIDPSKRNIGVLNLGIDGNHLLTDGLGPNLLARFDRDVLAHAGVRCMILLEGVNDLGTLSRSGEASADVRALLLPRMLVAYQQIVLRAHAHGIRVIGATIIPYMDSDFYHPAAEDEADRQQVNAWIRAPGHFDAVIDLDKAMADPAHPDHLLPTYDSGDHLHPSPAGYKAMAAAIPLSLLR